MPAHKEDLAEQHRLEAQARPLFCEACDTTDEDGNAFCEGCGCCSECCNCTATDCDCDVCEERRANA